MTIVRTMLAGAMSFRVLSWMTLARSWTRLSASLSRRRLRCRTKASMTLDEQLGRGSTRDDDDHGGGRHHEFASEVAMLLPLLRRLSFARRYEGHYRLAFSGSLFIDC